MSSRRSLSVRLGYDGLVPLRDRVRYVGAVRLAMAVAITVQWWFNAPESSTFERAAPVGFIAFSVLALAISAASNRARMLTLFAGSLLLDGIFLAATTYGSTSFDSPLKLIMVVHVLVCTLLGSFRTGLKVALWHTLLIASTFQYLEALNGDPGHGMRHMAVVLAVTVWVAAIATATLASLNERELRKRNLDLQDLADLALAMESCSTPAHVGRQLLRSALDVLPVERAFVALIENDAPTVIAGHGALGVVSAQADLGSVARAVETRSTQRIGRLRVEDDQWLATVLAGGQNVLVVPMHAEGQPVGALVMEYGPRRSARVEQRAVTILERLVAHSGLSLVNMRLLSQVRAQASTDGLTGLANRRRFDEVASQALEQCQAAASPMSLILLDIDHFKHLNDEHGHQVGDDTLRRIGALLEASVRPGDMPARYGGEEFAIVLPHTTADDAYLLAERLRDVVASAAMSPSITASLGVATTTSTDAVIRDVIENADLALYDAKRNGRNRVASAASPVQPAPPSSPSFGPVEAQPVERASDDTVPSSLATTL